MAFAASKEAEFAEIVPDRRVKTAAPLCMDTVMQIFSSNAAYMRPAEAFLKGESDRKNPLSCRKVKEYYCIL